MKRITKKVFSKAGSILGATVAVAAAVADPALFTPLAKLVGAGVAVKLAAGGAILAALSERAIDKKDGAQ